MNHTSVILFVLLCTGCASTSFSRYQGLQGTWPISQGSFVESPKHGADIIHGLPTRPYEVLGFVEGSGMERMNAFGGRSIWSPDVLHSVAKKAKKQGADAVILLSSEREFAGFFNYQQSYTSPTYAFGTATTMGPYTTVNLQTTGANTTGWGYSTPMYERRFSAIAIRYIPAYPEPHFLVNGQQLTGAAVQEYFYTKHSELKGRELLVTSVTPWIKWPQSGALDDGFESLASQVREVVKTESTNDMSGTWYGYFTQKTQRTNGSSAAGSANFRITFTQTQERILGNGNLASGETISFQGQIQGSAFTGSVINTTHGLQSTFSGTVTGQQITGEFSGVGSDQTFNGAFTVYR